MFFADSTLSTATGTTNQTDLFKAATNWTASFNESDPTATSNLTNTVRPTASDETGDEFNALIWLPYVIFTIALLGLICCSFIRFHYERGHQYRRRQEELNDKLQSTAQDGLQLLTADSIATTTLESSTSRDVERGNKPSTSAYSAQSNGRVPNSVPNHMNLFMQYSQVRPEQKFGRDYHPGNHNNNSNSNSGVAGGGAISSQQHGNCVKKPSNLKQHSSSNNNGKNRKSDTNRRPLVFTFNINGSMVDIRCGEEERTNTFRLNDDSTTTGGDYGGTEDVDLGVPYSGTVAFERHYCDGEAGGRSAGKRCPPNHRNATGSGSNSAGKARYNRGGGGASGALHKVVQNRTGQYVLSEDCDEDLKGGSSEDEALLLWQKHL